MYVRAVAKAVEVHSAQIGESFPRRIEKSAGGRIQPERLGRNSEISGISVIRISMTTMVAQIIKMSGKVSSTLIFNMRVVVNRHTAIGGAQDYAEMDNVVANRLHDRPEYRRKQNEQ